MKNESKQSFQERILRLLRGKRAVRRTSLIDELEALVPQESPAEGHVKPKYLINRTIKRMKDDGLFEVIESEQSEFFKITPTGRQKLRSIKLGSTDVPVPGYWDGKWRLVILDVPESDKKVRNALRYILKKANFVCLKNSVWISPYPFEHFLENMKEDLGLDHEMMIIVTSTLDARTKKYLELKYATD